MKKITKLFLGALAVALLGLGSIKAVQQLDNYLEAGGLNVQINGKRFFTVGGQAAVDNSIRVIQSSSPANGVATYTIIISTNGGVMVNGNEQSLADGPNGPGFYIGVGVGNYAPIGFSTMTAAQIRSQAPRRVGEAVYDASQGQLCVATGTSAGQWASAGSSTTVRNPFANTGQLNPCE